MSHYVPLEMSGDLWVPYQYDKDGNQIPRPDNIAPAPAAASAGILARSPDVAALLMQELQQARTQIPPAK